MVGELTSHQCTPGLIPRGANIMWVEFVVGSGPCSKGCMVYVFFFSCMVYRFSSYTKTNISKFQFDSKTVEVRATSWIPLNSYLFIILSIAGLHLHVCHIKIQKHLKTDYDYKCL